ncbi:hypothetical protein DFH06DRAFT_1042209, partial [Mycena polygramma]
MNGSSSCKPEIYALRRCPKCGALPTEPPREEAVDLDVVPGTRHYTLLNSNEAPEDSETTFIRAVVSTAEACVARLNEEIAKLQAQLEHLEEQRVSFSSYRARNSAILSPLRRMPPEVLGEIFIWTLPSPRNSLSPSQFDEGASPWVLPHISSRWRAIALATPHLW